VHADVCGILSLANPRQVASRLDDDERVSSLWTPPAARRKSP
jgi:prophage antirepressor-like protein